MSGTSGDGVDASLIKTNELDEYKVLTDKYFEYDAMFIKIFTLLKKKFTKFPILKILIKN